MKLSVSKWEVVRSLSTQVCIAYVELCVRLGDAVQCACYSFFFFKHVYLTAVILLLRMSHLLSSCRNTAHGNVCQPSSVYLLKPNVYVMHHQFNIQDLYALPTLYLCVLCLSENKQRLVPLAA